MEELSHEGEAHALRPYQGVVRPLTVSGSSSRYEQEGTRPPEGRRSVNMSFAVS